MKLSSYQISCQGENYGFWPYIYYPARVNETVLHLPDHMQKVAGQNPHLEPGLVGLEPLATGFVPTQGVLAFLDPVFYLGPPIVDLDHLAGGQPGVGDRKAGPGEKLALMPLDLGHYPSRPTPIFSGFEPRFGNMNKINSNMALYKYTGN